MRADRCQRLLQIGDQLQIGLAHMPLVIGLVRVEPLPAVVALERAQKAESGSGEVGLGHECQ
jgi:hypothetical protein